jgi:protocatechuate 3,4-dioxygenase beta subunit
MGPASGSTRVLVFAIALVAAVAAAIVWFLLELSREDPVLAPTEASSSRQVDPPSNDDPRARPATPLIRPAPLVDRNAPTPEQAGSATVLVEVLQGDGSPAAGTLVFVGSADKHSFLGYSESLAANFGRIKSPESRPAGVQVGTTDALGKYEFHDVKPAWKLTAGAWHPQLGTVTSFGSLIRDGETKSVVLKLPGAIRMLGYVTEPDGKPVAGASVQVLPRGEKSPLELVQTDADGRYETSRWPSRDFVLVVTTPIHIDASKPVQNVGPGELERRVDFQLERVRILRGRLLLADGSPAKVAEHIAPYLDPRDPDAKFQLIVAFEDPMARGGWVSTDRSHGQVNDRDDTYEVPMKGRMGRYVGIAFHRMVLGSAPIPGDKTAGGPDIVVDWSRIPPKAPLGNLVVFARSHTDAKPLTSYCLRIEKMEADPTKRSASQFEVKSVDGRHFQEGLLEGRYRIKVSALGFQSATTEYDVKADPAENEVVLRPAPAWAVIEGRVLGPAGTPIAGARVHRAIDQIDLDGGVWTWPDSSTLTDATGTFRFDRLAFGTYQLLAWAEGFAPAWGNATAETEAKAVTITLVEGVAVEVVPEGASGPFRLFVEDASRRIIVKGNEGVGVRFDERLTVRLMPGRYVAQVTGVQEPKEGRKSFEAAEGTVVRVPLWTPKK